MILVICSILLTVDAGGIPVITQATVEGKLLKESSQNLLVDFSEGVTEFKLAGKPSDYKKVLINKTECVKE
jgi:hypothetical protein